MRTHGTRACFVFGLEPGGDRSNGCRCQPCRAANAAYARARDRAVRRPDEGLDPAYVDTAEAIAHITWLRTQGIGLRTICARTGLGRTALTELASGQRTRARRTTIDKILGVGRSETADGALVDAALTWRHVEQLRAAGWTKARIGAAIGQAGRALQLGRTHVTARNARAISALWAREIGLADEARRQHLRDERAKYRAREKAS